MSFRARIAIALGCAVVAAALMAIYAAGVRGEAAEQRKSALERYGGETVAACVATRDIVRGETFSERNVAVVEWLVDLLPEGAYVDAATLMGKTAASTIAANTPVAAVDVNAQDKPLDIPAGLVAVSVPCSNESAVGGALAAGSAVDVYVVAGDAARLLCQGVQVLATNADGTAANLSWATIGVAPAEVEAVIAASSMQRLYFVLPSAEEIERREREAPPAALPEGEVAADGTVPAAQDAAPAEGDAGPVADGGSADAAVPEGEPAPQGEPMTEGDPAAGGGPAA